MPYHKCKNSLCIELLEQRGYCPKHVPTEEPVATYSDSDKHYDKTVRNPEHKKFYNSKEWEIARREKLSNVAYCEICIHQWATQVHHRSSLDQDWDQRTTQTNLLSVCGKCHKRIEWYRRGGGRN